MGSGSPSEVAALLVSLATARPPRLGGTRLVCIDGPAGSGKTTLGACTASLVDAQVVHTDELMSGWRGLGAVAEQLAALVPPLAHGEEAAYERFDWHLGRFAERVAVPAAPWLVVEGVGSGARELAAYGSVLAWVAVPDELRLARGLARDGVELSEQWRRFMLDERELFARDGAEHRADVVVDGTGARSPVVRRCDPS